MHYDDFVLQLDSDAQGGLRARVLRSPAGEGAETVSVPFDPAAVLDLLQTSGASRHRSGAAAGERHARGHHLYEPPQPSAQHVGAELFDSVFKGRVRSLLDQSLGGLRGAPDRGLRIKLKLDPQDERLTAFADLPWELLRRAETDDFLALSRLSPVVRYLDVPRPSQPIPFTPPLRILAAGASPRGLEPLDLAEESERLTRIAQHASGIDVRFIEHASVGAVREALIEGGYHVLHFMGHGDFDHHSGGLLFFERPDGSPEVVSGRALATTLKDLRDLGVVVLNACNTAAAESRGGGQSPFRGVATALVLGGLPAVVAMQRPIADLAAIEFSAAFYRHLARGESIDEAITEGRQAIHSAAPDTVEWAVPVLFLRVGDGNVFRLRPAEAERPAAVPAPPPPASTSSSVPEGSAAPSRRLPLKAAGVAAAAALAVALAVTVPSLLPSREPADPQETGEGTLGDVPAQDPESEPRTTGVASDEEDLDSQVKTRSERRPAPPPPAQSTTRKATLPESTVEAAKLTEPASSPAPATTTSDVSRLSTRFAALQVLDGMVRASVTFTNSGDRTLSVMLDCYMSDGPQRYDVIDSSLPGGPDEGYRLEVSPGGTAEVSFDFARLSYKTSEVTLFLSAAGGGRLKVADPTKTVEGPP